MKIRWLVIACAGLAFAGLGVIAADPALARGRHKVTPHCVDRPYHFSWEKLLFGTRPGPNGCAPPVYFGGIYVGQDPDPNIRFQLKRDPETGYTPLY
jgi:hypothetical protein